MILSQGEAHSSPRFPLTAVALEATLPTIENNMMNEGNQSLPLPLSLAFHLKSERFECTDCASSAE